MSTTDVAIIGGSAAGLSAALTLRKRFPEKRVVLVRDVEKTPVPCGIPYIFGTLGSVDKDIIPDEKFLAMGVEIRHARVTAVDRGTRTIRFEGGAALAYGKLILAVGSKAQLPPIAGIELPGVFTVRKDPAHLNRLHAELRQAQNVVVIGGGFIGVEMAEQINRMFRQGGDDYFCHADMPPARVTVVEMAPRCLLQAFEEEFCVAAEAELQKEGVRVLTGARVEAIVGSDRVEGVRLADGTELPAEVVVIGIGAAPNIDLARQMGLECDPDAGVRVDSHQQTSDADILAAGDCAGKTCSITGRPSWVRLASVACSEGMVAASNVEGEKRQTRGTIGAFATMIGDIGLASCGLTTAAAAEAQIPVIVGEATAPNRHPGGLPGCIPQAKAKLLFRRQDRKVVGGHVLGGESAADMANIIAVAIHAGLTAEDLATTQFATHPLLTASPLLYHIMAAAENAAMQD